jgi:hypothetical protein
MYFKAKRNYLRIDDRGDIVIAYQQQNEQNNVKIDVLNSAQAVEDKFDTFLGEMEIQRKHGTIAQHRNTHISNQPHRQYPQTRHQTPHNLPHRTLRNYNTRTNWNAHVPPAQTRQTTHQTPHHRQNWQPERQRHQDTTTHQQRWQLPAPPTRYLPETDAATIQNLLQDILKTAANHNPAPQPTPIQYPQTQRINTNATAFLA